MRKRSPAIWIVLSDIHYPVHSKSALKAVFNFLSRNKVAGIVLLGDFLDFETISHHTKGKPRLRRRGGYKEDIEGFKADILDEIESRLPRGCKKIAIKGNHERFLEDWLDENPELEGVVDLEKNLELAKRGWQVVQVGGTYKLNNVLLLHGDQIGSGMHVAKKMVDEVCRICLMGHVHRFSAYTKTGVQPEDKWVGITLPCLSTLAPAYAKGKLNAYLQGFGIIESWGYHRTNIYVPVITDGQFSFGGRLYGK